MSGLPFTSALLFGALWAAGILLEYAWHGHWRTRRNLGLLSIVPLLDILLS